MKRALRIIVPLVLILVVLASTAWYFLIYDKDLTKEMLLWGARTFESNGNHEAAAWMYDLAYSQSSQEDDVAMELARQYMGIGNYTKAEYTLTEAISKNPTKDLYIALSKLYIAQDKLLDAVNMLDTMGHDSIRAELEAIRPATPSVSYESGFYNQYISIALEGTGGKICVSTDSAYPSATADVYTGPIALGAGETTLYCLCVGDNGLVSPLGRYDYTIDGVVEEVNFTDDAIESAIRTQLNLGKNTQIYTNDLWDIAEFTVPAETENYEDIAFLSRLKVLTMENAPAGALARIGTMEQLETLSMTDCKFDDEDLATLGTITTLKKLTLANCGISTVSELKSLEALEYLDLSNNSIRNLTPLASMTKLQHLLIPNNAVTDLAALSGLPSLVELDASFNSITSVNAVCGLTKLTSLNVANNQISQISDVDQLTELTSFDISFNTVEDVSALAACTKLEVLNIANNAVTDITMLDTLSVLEYFYLANNQIEELPEFAEDAALVCIDASYNLLSTVKQLEGLAQLNTVNVDYNEKIDSLKPLDKCHVLIQVNAYGTKVKDVTFLTDKSIVVNYDPTLKK